MNKFVKKYSIIAILWVVAILAAVFCLPNISNLEAQKGQTKIPANMQSQVANNIQKHWGHHISNTREIVLVYNNGNQEISKADQNKINDKVDKLQDNSDYYGIKGVTSVKNTPVAKKQLISKDKTTELVQLNVSKKDSVEQVNKKLQDGAKVSGMKSYVTGADVLNDDMRLSMVQGIKKTEIIATIFILIVLIMVFKSIVVPLISILTVGVSFITSLSLIMNLVKYFNFPLSNFTQVFLVVVLFGIGTDYNILLYDQFKEDLSDGMDKIEATIHSRKVAGKTILYSGISVLIGFTALGLANFSIYRSGVAVAVGVVILLLVLLTLNPFFMVFLGKNMFWPLKNLQGENKRSKLWGFLSTKSVQFAIPAILLVLVVTLPLIAIGHGNLNYDDAIELNNNIPSKKGLLTVQKHFSKGTAEPATIYIKSDHSLNNQKSLMSIDRITRQLEKRNDVKTVASVTQPSGEPIKKLYLNDQLGMLTGKMGQANEGLDKLKSGASNNSFTGDQLKAIAQSAQSIGQRLQTIQGSAASSGSVSGQQVVAMIQQKATAMGAPLNSAQLQIVGGALQQAASQAQSQQSGMATQLNGIASDTQNIGSNTQSMANQLMGVKSQLGTATKGIDKISKGSEQANDYLSALQDSPAASDTFYIPNQVLESDEFKQSLNNYLSSNMDTTRIVVVLKNNPSSSAAMKTINSIQSQVKANIGGTDLSGSKVAISGQTATMSDTNKIATKDFFRTAVIMLVGILLALIFVTKSILQPIYIEGTLLLAYLSSLTITKFISGLVLGQKMLTWNTPFFTFIMIIALGVDYSIFLMRKYQEIDPGTSPANRIISSSKFIGIVVLSAALILGGTFAALIPSGVLTLIQVAIAVIIGLLILIIILPMLMSAAVKLTYSNKDKE